MKKIIILWLGALLMAAPICFAQTFEGLYDADTTEDWGWNVFIKPDSSYMIIGGAYTNYGQGQLMTMNISADGSEVISKHVFRFGDSSTSIYVGDPETSRQLPGGSYLVPVTLQLNGQTRSWAGLAKLDAQGDTIFVKTYTDTSVYFDAMNTCAVMQNGNYLAGGIHAKDTASYYPGLLICTDSNGNLLWEHPYQKDTTQSVTIERLDTLSNGRILVGAMSSYYETNGGFTYQHNSPWFMILDSVGNVLKDTVYGPRYGGGGAIFKDLNGGYYHFGDIDTLINPNLTYGSFPNYLAHLDTNFNIEWITVFNYSEYFQQRECATVKQLRDSSYIIAGDIGSNNTGWAIAWAAKVASNGTLLWNHTFVSDSDGDSYFRDVAERNDGSLVFCGAAHSDTLPSWHLFQDAWLVSVDSNGCLQPGCGPDTTDLSLGVPASPILSKGEVMVYPNPTHGNLTVKTNESGVLYIYTMLGQEIAQYPIIAGQTEIKLPPGISPGVYMSSFRPANGAAATEVRIVFENNY